MAEGEDHSNTGGWFGNWMNVAKSKSSEVLDFMKKDFEVIKNEATNIVNSTTNVVKETLQLDKSESAANTVKKSVSSFFENVKEVLTPSTRDDNEEDAILIQNGDLVKMNRLQTKIYLMAKDDRTYLDPISEDDKDKFEAWRGIAGDTLTNVNKLTTILASNQMLQDHYTKLVPDKLDHNEFWERFLFRKALLEDQEAELQRRFEKDQKQVENYEWEKEKIDGDIELTDEQQTKILEEYENEIKTTNKIIHKVNDNNKRSSQENSSTSTDFGDWEKDFECEEN